MSPFKNEGESLYKVNDIGEFMEAVAQRIYYYNHQRIHKKPKMPPAIYAKIIGLSEVDKVSGKMGGWQSPRVPTHRW